MKPPGPSVFNGWKSCQRKCRLTVRRMRVLDLYVWCQDLKEKILLPHQEKALIFMLKDAKIIL